MLTRAWYYQTGKGASWGMQPTRHFLHFFRGLCQFTHTFPNHDVFTPCKRNSLLLVFIQFTLYSFYFCLLLILQCISQFGHYNQPKTGSWGSWSNIWVIVCLVSNNYLCLYLWFPTKKVAKNVEQIKADTKKCLILPVPLSDVLLFLLSFTFFG